MLERVVLQTPQLLDCAKSAQHQAIDPTRHPLPQTMDKAETPPRIAEEIVLRLFLSVIKSFSQVL